MGFVKSSVDGEGCKKSVDENWVHSKEFAYQNAGRNHQTAFKKGYCCRKIFLAPHMCGIKSNSNQSI
jgi:hypothetical protein